MIKNQNAFTLIELMVAIGIAGIVLSFATINFVNGLPKYRLIQAVWDLSSRLRKARTIAVMECRPVTVKFDINQKKYNIDGIWYPSESLTNHYGSGINFGRGNSGTGDSVTFEEDELSFNSRGAGNSGIIFLNNTHNEAYRVTVSNAGIIRVQHWDGGDWR